VQDKTIDNGKFFDWGRVSLDYARYRDIYPSVFYERIAERNLCVKGQKALDLGTGTGVLPRNMYQYGAEWTAADISPNQINQAVKMSEDSNLNINYIVSSTEELDFPNDSFDVVTACQCFWYFNHDITAPKIYNMLKKGGSLLILYMAWLPFEDKIAGESEKLVLKYSPNWSGARETFKPICIPEIYSYYFELNYHDEYRVKIPFTKQTWHGRMKACRGVGASLNESELKDWEQEHIKLLNRIAPEEFEVQHYCAVAQLKVKK